MLDTKEDCLRNIEGVLEAYSGEDDPGGLEMLKKISGFVGCVGADCSFEAAIKEQFLQLMFPDLAFWDWQEVLPILDEEHWGWMSPR